MIDTHKRTDWLLIVFGRDRTHTHLQRDALDEKSTGSTK